MEVDASKNIRREHFDKTFGPNFLLLPICYIYNVVLLCTETFDRIQIEDDRLRCCTLSVMYSRLLICGLWQCIVLQEVDKRRFSMF